MIIGKPSDPLAGPTPARSGPSGIAAAARVEPGIAGDSRVEPVQQPGSVKLAEASRVLAIASADDIRAEKVAAVKKAVEDGTYRVRAEVVADRLISDSIEMLGAMKTRH